MVARGIQYPQPHELPHHTHKDKGATLTSEVIRK